MIGHIVNMFKNPWMTCIKKATKPYHIVNTHHQPSVNPTSAQNIKIAYTKGLANYLKKTAFSSLCVGFFDRHCHRTSGTIGQRRAKRAEHLLKRASDEGIVVLAQVLRNNTSLNSLKTFLDVDMDPASIQATFDAKYGAPSNTMTTFIDALTRFLDVVNVEAAACCEIANKVIQGFSFQEAKNPNSQLSRDIAKFHRAVTCQQSMIALQMRRW